MARRLAALAAPLASLALLPGGAGAATPQQAIDNLNAQRAAHGIPAGIVELPQWSDACAKHNNYQRQNGGDLTHDEEPGKPGYTDEGRMAAQNSVLSLGASWDSSNPWETAPIHLSQLLAPRLDAMGIDDSGGYTCATTLISRGRPAPPDNVFYTYPGNGTSHRSAETASEGPYTPGERVGIPAGTQTGPYLYVFLDGPSFDEFTQARITAASLTGPDGPVEIKVADNFTSGLEYFMPAGGVLIPVKPLKDRRTYRGMVTVQPGGRPDEFSHLWSFNTGGTGTPVEPMLELGKGKRTGGRVVLPLRADPALVGRSAKVTTRRKERKCRTRNGRRRCKLEQGKPKSKSITLADSQNVTASQPKRAGDSVKVTVSTAAFSASGIDYESAKSERTFKRK